MQTWQQSLHVNTILYQKMKCHVLQLYSVYQAWAALRATKLKADRRLAVEQKQQQRSLVHELLGSFWVCKNPEMDKEHLQMEIYAFFSGANEPVWRKSKWMVQNHSFWFIWMQCCILWRGEGGGETITFLKSSVCLRFLFALTWWTFEISEEVNVFITF